MESKKNIDQLFKDGLSEPDIPFNELDWTDMARKLDEQSRRKSRQSWLLWSSAVAAVFLIVLFWMFAGEQPKLDKHPEKGLARTRKDINPTVPNTREESTRQGESKPAVEDLGDQPALAKAPQPGTAGMFSIRPNRGTTGDLADPGRPALAAERKHDVLPELGLAAPTLGKVAASDQYAAAEKPTEKREKQTQTRNRQVILSAIVAPDLSYAKSPVGSKVSSNFGLLATYAFHPRLSVTTGAIYANKYYNSKGDGAVNYGADNHSLQINALCNVIDIPVNLNYRLLSKKALTVSLNTGLSSYIMLKEKYDYIYSEGAYAESTVSMEIKNQNRHMFGVANVALSFDRRISPQLSIGVQPFMKLPLTGIGYGKADLKSTGVSFSVNMGLFPAKKPAKATMWSGLRR